jgi:hypothetical protein
MSHTGLPGNVLGRQLRRQLPASNSHAAGLQGNGLEQPGGALRQRLKVHVRHILFPTDHAQRFFLRVSALGTQPPYAWWHMPYDMGASAC